MWALNKAIIAEIKKNLNFMDMVMFATFTLPLKKALVMVKNNAV